MNLNTAPRRRPADQGSGAIALILAALLFMVVAGFLVDTGRAIHQRERSADVAEQAARYAANHISADALRNGGTVTIDSTNCPANVQAFVRQSGFSEADTANSTCTATSGNSVSVRVRLTYTPLLMNLGDGHLTVWGNATAQAVRNNDPDTKGTGEHHHDQQAPEGPHHRHGCRSRSDRHGGRRMRIEREHGRR